MFIVSMRVVAMSNIGLSAGSSSMNADCDPESRHAATALDQIAVCSARERANSDLRRRDVRQPPIRLQPRVQVLAEQVAQRRLRTIGQNIDALVGRTDGVRLLDDQLAPAVEARRRPGERKGDQKSEQTEYRAFDDAEALLRAVWISASRRVPMRRPISSRTSMPRNSPPAKTAP